MKRCSKFTSGMIFACQKTNSKDETLTVYHLQRKIDPWKFYDFFSIFIFIFLRNKKNECFWFISGFYRFQSYRNPSAWTLFWYFRFKNHFLLNIMIYVNFCVSRTEKKEEKNTIFQIKMVQILQFCKDVNVVSWLNSYILSPLKFLTYTKNRCWSLQQRIGEKNKTYSSVVCSMA